MTTDLFGNPVAEDKVGQRVGKGHAAPPGSGPKDETCGTCRSYKWVTWSRNNGFAKCLLMKELWNHSYGSDIRKKDPACREWQPREKKPNCPAPVSRDQTKRVEE